MNRIAFAILCVVFAAPLLGAQTRNDAAVRHVQEPPEWARLVADRFLDGTDMAAAEIFGNFNSFDLLAQTLDLRSIVGNYRGKPVTLRNILLSVDFNGTGDVAIWKVIGPKPLVDQYIAQLQTGYETHKVFYDYEAKTYPATICCPD
jgi:hypothetical protein